MKFLEFGNDPALNRRYFAELLVLLSLQVLLVYITLTILAGLFIRSDNDFLRGLGAAAYLFNVYMCHQIPERSFFLFGEPMGLCERCFAIFIGALFAYPASLWRQRMPSILRMDSDAYKGARVLRSWSGFSIIVKLTSREFCIAWGRHQNDFLHVPLLLLFGVGLLGIDGTAQLFGFWESDPFVRVVTGFLASFTIMSFLLNEVLDKFHPKGSLFRTSVLAPASSLTGVVLLALAGAALLLGPHYVSESSAIGQAMELSPGAASYEAHYIAPKAFEVSIAADQYVSGYTDPVLSDIAHANTRKNVMGAWAVLALEEPAKREGRYTFISGGKGTYYYFDAWTGELALTRRHSS